MEKTNQTKSILFAFLAAAFYAVNVPLSKLLLEHVGPTTMAALLYLGAGIGIGILSIGREKGESLTKDDLPFVVGMIVLDIAAPVFLMFGVSLGSSSNASLLGNFEIVATSVIALLVFREAVSKRLWGAIFLITLSSLLLSFEGTESFRFSRGSLLVLLATICWGFENNCTRKISSKSTYEIVILKGIFSGLGALAIALIKREAFPGLAYISAALALGFVAYGLSIFLYVRAQSVLGAAKTSAYYAVAPFIGAVLSFVFLKERLTGMYLIALAVMIAGTALVVKDTLIRNHTHLHPHTFTHTHDGSTHSHTIMHAHDHEHILLCEGHTHHHSKADLEAGMNTHSQANKSGTGETHSMKKALLVIDMQEATVGKNHADFFKYEDDLIQKVNAVISGTDAELVVYIRNLMKHTLINKLAPVKVFDGLPEAELAEDLIKVSPYVYSKYTGDAFSNPEFSKLLRDKHIDTVEVVGVDGGGCVSLTALGAIDNEYNVIINAAATGTMYEKKQEKLFNKLRNAGAQIAG